MTSHFSICTKKDDAQVGLYASTLTQEAFCEMTKILTTIKKNQTKTLETYTQEINLANTRFSRIAKEELGY